MAKRLVCAVCGKLIVVSECISLEAEGIEEQLQVEPCDCMISNFLKQQMNHTNIDLN